jgi:hypothetical protein
MTQNPTKPISIPIPIPTSIPPEMTPSTPQSPVRTLSKRNKTFFERFDQTAPSNLRSNPPSPTHHQQQSIDSSNPSIDPPPRLRRRLTFRRSLRHSVRNKGGDIDDGIRSVISYSFVNFLAVDICFTRHQNDR